MPIPLTGGFTAQDIKNEIEVQHRRFWRPAGVVSDSPGFDVPATSPDNNMESLRQHTVFELLTSTVKNQIGSKANLNSSDHWRGYPSGDVTNPLPVLNRSESIKSFIGYDKNNMPLFDFGGHEMFPATSRILRVNQWGTIAEVYHHSNFFSMMFNGMPMPSHNKMFFNGRAGDFQWIVTTTIWSTHQWRINHPRNAIHGNIVLVPSWISGWNWMMVMSPHTVRRINRFFEDANGILHAAVHNEDPNIASNYESIGIKYNRNAMIMMTGRGAQPIIYNPRTGNHWIGIKTNSVLNTVYHTMSNPVLLDNGNFFYFGYTRSSPSSNTVENIGFYSVTVTESSFQNINFIPASSNILGVQKIDLTLATNGNVYFTIQRYGYGPAFNNTEIWEVNPYNGNVFLMSTLISRQVTKLALLENGDLCAMAVHASQFLPSDNWTGDTSIVIIKGVGNLSSSQRMIPSDTDFSNERNGLSLAVRNSLWNKYHNGL